MAYSTMRSAIPLGSVSGGTFTAKLQNACTSTLYPEGTVFDCSGFTSRTIPSQFITGTITITRPGITLLFSEGDFIWNPTGGTALDANMFEIVAPNVTIIGVSRSAKDSVSTNGATRFVMNSPSTGYHVYTRPDLTTYASADSLTIMNCDFVGVKSIYTSSGGTVNYSTTGAGGILLTEGNVDQPNSNLNNVMISEVLVSGAKQHGVMIYGGMASKLQNVRVRNAGGHGFYIAGSTTSTSLDACYASGNYLAGFCINDTTYSTLTSCASDSNGLGYWMRNANSVTLNSCGAEACEVRSSIPNNLGITVKNSAGDVLINDIGSDNVNFIKGTSFLFTGGSNITGTSCYSKDPGNRAGLSTFLSKYTAHIHGVDGTTKVNMDNFKAAGTSTTKYLYRLEDVNNFHIDDLVTQYDPTNPTESPDGSMTFVNQILDQGANNIFGDFATSTSWLGRRVDIANSEDDLRVNQLYVPGRLSIPVEPAHPANPQSGTIYFNNTLNKLFMYSGSAWFDTCCTTTPQPECIFPAGFSEYAQMGTGSAVIVGDYIWSNAYAGGGSGVPFIAKTSISTFETTYFYLESLFGSFSSSLTYSATENALYWGAGALSSQESSYLVKFSLTTNSTVASQELSLTGSQVNATAIVVNGYLYVTRGNDTIEKRNLTDLSLVDTFSDSGAHISIPLTNAFVVTSDHKIVMARRQGFQNGLTVFDTDSESFDIVNISNATSSNKATSLYIDSNDDIWVASQYDGLITKYDSSITEVDQFANSYIVNPTGLYVNEINGKTIVTFATAGSIPSIGGIWALTSYNVTDDSFIGSSQNFNANTWYGPTSMIELSSTTFGFTGGKFYTICTPYAS
jgi:hypothetical protein